MDVATPQDRKDKAVAEKDSGNAYYRKREFEKALEHYEAAILLDPTNITFYTNKAAVYFEQTQHEKCRDCCLEAIEIGRKYGAEAKLIAKAFTRIGNSFMKEKDFEKALEFFKKSVCENRTEETLEKVAQCEKEIKDAERLAYINPDVSQEERAKGDELFEAEQYEGAILHYTEAIRRNPDNAKLYIRRAVSLMKLEKYRSALNDCEECINKNQNLIRGHILKGAALEALQDYDKAMDSYQRAMDLDPNAKEAIKAYYRCLNTDYYRRNTSESVHDRVMGDAEVQQIMSDPKIKNFIDTVGSDPNRARHLMGDPEAAGKLRKLYDLGLVTVQC